MVLGGKHRDKECDGEVGDSDNKHTSIQIANASAVAGAISGAVSRFIVGPLDVMKIRFQVQLEPIHNAGGVSKYRSLTQAFATIVKEEGIQVRDRRACLRGEGRPAFAVLARLSCVFIRVDLRNSLIESPCYYTVNYLTSN